VRALQPLDLDVRAATTGDEAMRLIREHDVSIMLLDLRMPGMDGMAVLREVAHAHPDVKVAILTAHGTIEDAVEAMKLGAVDFVQKPFSVSEIRELVRRILARETLTDDVVRDYDGWVELAKKLINQRSFPQARAAVANAVAAAPANAAEAYNLSGILEEMRGRRVEAQARYRVALDMQPDYAPAIENLRRSMKPPEDRGAMSID
jgi:DNA-binding NtrC family response regulator